jgi:Lon protease-like protein
VPPDQTDIPLFPLGVVLFPGMALPLHIFEDRYRQMIGRCLETKEGFGVLLIREGQEVGEPAVPFEVGTLAEITSVQRLPDGRMHLVAVGTRRFRCVEHRQERPYRVASVTWLEDEASPSTDYEELAGQVRAAVDQYLEAVYAVASRPKRSLELLDDATALSFQVAALLRIAPREQQRLLESLATEARLRQELAYLERETRLYRMLLKSDNAKGFSRN